MPKPKTKRGKPIKVRITASQRVTYNQVVEMTDAEYRELKRRQESDQDFGVSFVDHDLGGWLDLRDIDDGGDLEDIEIAKVK